MTKPGDGIKRRGFASMDPEKRREVASKGGKMAQEIGTGHRWTRSEARDAGRRAALVRAFRRQYKRLHEEDK